jgi:hypothetical protein
MQYAQDICVPANGNAVAEVHSPPDAIREQLIAYLLQFKNEFEQMVAPLSLAQYFRVENGIMGILELVRQQVYARLERTAQ